MNREVGQLHIVYKKSGGAFPRLSYLEILPIFLMSVYFEVTTHRLAASAVRGVSF